MQETPLHYFEDLFLDEELLKNAPKSLLDLTGKSIIRYDEKSQYIVVTEYMEVDGQMSEELVDYSFQEYFEKNIKFYRNECLKEINSIAYSLNDEKLHQFLNRVQQNINGMLNSFNSVYCNRSELFPIRESLHFILKEIKNTYLSKVVALDNARNKLKWNGGPATLATLFHELSKESFSNSSKPYLEADHKELFEFICFNFTDENGNSFSEASIKTYLDPKKKTKKAKRDKVDTEKILSLKLKSKS
jgi:hypothetical protein